ncbi:MAG: RibD family protein [Cyanobacteria bacterium REEB417]|nr:RibD family protein [Cyanobacteria bacterium REEB417]
MRPQTRLVLAISLDGRLAPAHGGPAQLGGKGDRRALEEALTWADGCLIGAQTLRLHGSTCLIKAPDLQLQRRSQGSAAQPVAIVVSRSGQLPPELPFFAQPVERWLLQPPAGSGRPPGFTRHLPWRDWAQALAVLGEQGLRRLVVLGGAQLAAGLLQADCIDGMQLTLCPRLLAGPHSWVPAATRLPLGQAGWQLEHQQHLGDGEVLLRYGRTAL